MLVHRNPHALSLLVRQLYIAVVGAQGVILREEVGFVHVFHRLVPDAYLVACLTVGIVLLRAATIPCNVVELVSHRSGETDTWKNFRQTALWTQMVLDPDRSVIIEMIGIIESEAAQLHTGDVEVECAVG